MKKKGIAWSKWKVARTIWPFPEGHGVFRENYFTGEKIILDTGIPKETAEQIAKDLNDGKSAYEVGRTVSDPTNSNISKGKRV